MKFGILALDYDGTIARDGVLDPDVKSAIAEARARGIVVVLVTGRILSDLKRVTGGIEFVDAVVAENGAVRRVRCVDVWPVHTFYASARAALLRARFVNSAATKSSTSLRITIVYRLRA